MNTFYAVTTAINPSLDFRSFALAGRYANIFRAASQGPWLLLACKLAIGLVSAYDIFLTIKYVHFLPTMELNPAGRWLMSLDSGPECHLDQIACFVAAKFTGNFLTLAIIELLCFWRRNVAVSVALSVALAQLVLLTFLMTG